MALIEFILQVAATHELLDIAALLFISSWFHGPMVWHPLVD